MNQRRSSLSFRVRYEGRVQTIDRRPPPEPYRASIRYIVARTLSPFRAKWHLQTSEAKPTEETPLPVAQPDEAAPPMAVLKEAPLPVAVQNEPTSPVAEPMEIIPPTARSKRAASSGRSRRATSPAALGK